MNKAKQKILYYLENTYCRLMPSKIAGVGVFAIRNIPANTELFKGQIDDDWLEFHTEELKKLDKEILTMIDDFFVIEKDGTVFIPRTGLNGLDMSFYVNNSKKPNAKVIDEGFTFFSARKIRKGEEITVSYATYDWKYK